MNKINYLRFVLAIAFYVIAFSCFGQNRKLEEIESYLKEKKYEEVIQFGKTIDTLKLSAADKAKLQYSLGEAYRYRNSEDIELEYFLRARENYKKVDSINKVDELSLNIIRILASNSLNLNEAKAYIDDYLAYAQAKGDSDLLSKAYMELTNIFYDNYPEKALGFAKLALKENLKTNDEYFKGRIYQAIGACYASDRVGKPDSSLMVYKDALRIYQKYNKKSRIAQIYINRGVAYTKKKEYEKALKEFNIADTCELDEFKLAVKSYIQKYAAKAYKEMGDYQGALEAFEKNQRMIDSLKIEDQQKAVNDYETKYKTKEKELENQKLTSENRIKTIVLFSISGVFILLLIIGLLLLNHLSKKRKIAEQEKTIETQKMQTLLREQELHEIDVMLESQEKERQRIANDLHDNLGSLLSALKLNFHTLGKREVEDTTSRKLFEKTEELINETYIQVRNISHLKNLGVVGNEGLLLAVKKMAEKMSVINRLKFNVIPFGLKDRLESNLEIILFRMIQELSSNIIKHSEATEVNIYLTQHQGQQLNIMIEDNGKGFDVAELKQMNAGIGLKNIEKKVEQLGGTFTIDTVKGKGTTIIIDIPL